MKKPFGIKKVITALILVFVFSCESFVEIAPQDTIVASDFYQSIEQMRQGTAALYALPWFTYNDKAAIAIGDGGGGNWTTNDEEFKPFSVFQVPATFAPVDQAWSSFYNVIAYANILIFTIENSTDNFEDGQEALSQALGEARFMRGVAYFYLATLYGNVPIIENSESHFTNQQIPPHLRLDVYDFAIRDLEFAAENLKLEDEEGRVTQWSAKGMLSKIHLYRSGLDSEGGVRNSVDLLASRTYAKEVIAMSGKQLRENFGDLFKISEESNNEGIAGESLWSLQWRFRLVQWGVQNTHQAYFTPDGSICSCGDGWGAGNGPTPDILSLFEEQDVRRKETFMLRGDFYPEIKQPDGYHYNEMSLAGGAVKKYVVGSPDDNGGQVGFMNSPLNTYMLRLAEVHLIHAEAILGDAQATSDVEALASYNAIRNRAGLDSDEDGAISFLDIFNEKRRELAMESNTWYELVRWEFFDSQAAIDYVSRQNRARVIWEVTENDTTAVPGELFFTPSAADFFVPYPEGEVSINPLLKGDPIRYDFDQ